jgi:hypothetical protein
MALDFFSVVLFRTHISLLSASVDLFFLFFSLSALHGTMVWTYGLTGTWDLLNADNARYQFAMKCLAKCRLLYNYSRTVDVLLSMSTIL